MTRKRRRSTAPNNSSRTLFFPVELVEEILSLLKVKTIVRLRCVSKSWNNLISDPIFVEKHLKISSQNPHLTICWHKGYSDVKNVVPILVQRLLKKPYATVFSDKFHRMKKCQFIGSCNGLFCFLFHSRRQEPLKYWLRFSNPATRTISEKLGLFCLSDYLFGDFEFTFGYVASTRTYKVVAFSMKKTEGSWKSQVKVFNLGDNCWKSIQSFPLVPLESFDYTSYGHILPFIRLKSNDGVHFNGTINWFALDKSNTQGEQFVIISLDLSTESYKQFRLPPGYKDVHVPFSNPTLRVLMDCLCFSHDSNQTEFVLWKMKEYGIQESWTQLFKISYQNLAMNLPMHIIEMDYACHLELVCLYVKGDTVIFKSKSWKHSFIYNLTEKTFVRIKSKNRIQWLTDAKDYVESLVSVR